MTLDALAEALASKIDVTWTPDRDAIAEALAQAERMGMERAAKMFEGTNIAAAIRAEMGPHFPNVSCSQCGRDFGLGDHGFSHCRNHAGIVPK